MIRFCIACITLSLLLVSCESKDLPAPLDEEPEANFYALTVGNTWNYEFFMRVGQTEEFESIQVFNTVEITGTTEIDGENYYIFTTTTIGNENGQAPCNENGVSNERVRDSLGYLINEFGEIRYSQLNPEPYLIKEEYWADIYGELKEGTVEITVEAGVFTSVENERYAIFENGTKSGGSDRLFYADGVGLVQENYSRVTYPPHLWENRLMSYEIVEE